MVSGTMHRASGEIVGAGCIEEAGSGLSASRSVPCCCRRPAQAAGSAGSHGACRTRRSREAGRSDGRYGRIRPRRMAEDDVSMYTQRKKQESREGEQKKEKKREGGETHRYPARKRRIRRCCDAKEKMEWSDRIAVGAVWLVRLGTTPVDGLDYVGGNKPK